MEHENHTIEYTVSYTALEYTELKNQATYKKSQFKKFVIILWNTGIPRYEITAFIQNKPCTKIKTNFIFK